jgi:hypothetical protein
MKKCSDPMMVWLGALPGDIILTSRLYESVMQSPIYEQVTGDNIDQIGEESDED